MSREDRQFTLRLPHALHAEIQAAAKSNSRAMNAEIVVRLQNGSGDVAAQLAEINYLLGLLVKRAEAQDAEK